MEENRNTAGQSPIAKIDTSFQNYVDRRKKENG